MSYVKAVYMKVGSNMTAGYKMNNSLQQSL